MQASGRTGHIDVYHINRDRGRLHRSVCDEGDRHRYVKSQILGNAFDTVTHFV